MAVATLVLHGQFPLFLGMEDWGFPAKQSQGYPIKQKASRYFCHCRIYKNALRLHPRTVAIKTNQKIQGFTIQKRRKRAKEHSGWFSCYALYLVFGSS